MQPPPPSARWLGASPVPVWGLAPARRLGRQLAAAGIADHGDWTGQAPGPGPVLLFLADHVYDDALVRALAEAPGTVLLRPDGRPVAAHVPADQAEEAARRLASGDMPEGRTASPSALAAAHRAKLRKREAPFVLPVTEASRAEVERRLFDASYKGVTDAVTKYLWPAPARLATRLAVAAGISPNAVTIASLVLAAAAFVLFRDGWLWAGLAAAWGMTFLDTVDGKLARVTLTSSRMGDVLDHGLDLLHPPFWWWAWHVGTGGGHPLALAVVVAGYVLLRLQEGAFLGLFGIEIHVWRRFDSLFRLVTARRNPFLVILTLALAAGLPAAGMLALAGWTLVSLAVHLLRILQALRLRRAGGSVASWLAA